MRTFNQKRKTMTHADSPQTRTETADHQHSNEPEKHLNCFSERVHDCCCNFCSTCSAWNCFKARSFDVQTKPTSSKSLHHHCPSNARKQPSPRSTINCLNLDGPSSLNTDATLTQETNYLSNDFNSYRKLSNPSLWPKLSLRRPHHVNSPPIDFLRFPPTTLSTLCTLLEELRFLTSRLKTDDNNNSVMREWKFASKVLDRFCLLLFTTFTVSCTALFFISANSQDV